MTHVVITIRFEGGVVEHRVVRLREAMRLGEARGSAVSFPGATLVVARDALGWTVGGHRLVLGRTLVLGFGSFDVALEGVVEEPAVMLPGVGPDLRMVLATAAAVLAASSWDTAYHVVAANPALAAQVQAYLLAPSSPEPAAPSVESKREEPWTPSVGFASEAPGS